MKAGHFRLMFWHSEYHPDLLFSLAFPHIALSGEYREPSYYYQVDMEVQVPCSASIDTWGKKILPNWDGTPGSLRSPLTPLGQRRGRVTSQQGGRAGSPLGLFWHCLHKGRPRGRPGRLTMASWGDVWAQHSALAGECYGGVTVFAVVVAEESSYHQKLSVLLRPPFSCSSDQREQAFCHMFCFSLCQWAFPGC